MGRFLTSDPDLASARAASPGTWNRYAYVNGDPAKLIDPKGLDESDESGDGDDFCDVYYDYWSCDPFGVSPLGHFFLPWFMGQGGGGAALSYSEILKLRLQSLIKSLRGSNCDKVLSAAGISLDQLSSNGSGTNYYVGAASSGPMSGIVPGTGNEDISDYASDWAKKGAVAVSVQLGGAASPGDVVVFNTVVLTNLWPGSSSDWQNFTLLHEDLHYTMQTGDAQMLLDFGIKSSGNLEDGDPFTNWLMNGCVNK